MRSRSDKMSAVTGRPSARIAIASGLLVVAVAGVVFVQSSSRSERAGTQRSLRDPSYLYEGKPEPAWIFLGNRCGAIRDRQHRYVMFAADVQVPVTSGTQAPNGPAPIASASSMTCPEFNHWAAQMLAIGKAKAFAVSAPEVQAWCSEYEVVHHSCLTAP